MSVRRALEFIVETFQRDEADGYRSRDRQFAIAIGLRALKEPEPACATQPLEQRIEALIAVVRGFGCHSVNCIPELECSCGASAALQAAGLDEAEVWKAEPPPAPEAPTPEPVAAPEPSLALSDDDIPF